MSNNEWTTVTPKRYVAPHARTVEPPPAPRRPTRAEEYPTLPGMKKTKIQPVKLENTFNRLAQEMQEERERQELADAAEEAARIRRQRLPAGMVLMPPPPQTGPYTRFRRCDGLVIEPLPMEYRDEDWDPIGSHGSDDEHEQNTELAETQDRH
jgi:hypothetical protein